MSGYPLTVVLIAQKGSDVPAVYIIEDEARFGAALKAKEMYLAEHPGARVEFAHILKARFDAETGHVMLTIEHDGWEPYEGTLEEYLYPDPMWSDPYAWVTTCWAGDEKSFEAWRLGFIRDLVTGDLIEKRLV